MKPLFFALALALAGTSAMAAEVESHGPHPFNIRDLVMMDRVGDPQLSPDGRYALYTVRATDYAANKGVTSIYLLDLEKNAEPVKLVDKASSPRWAPDGSAFYYVAPKDGVAQVWRHPLGKATDAQAVQVTHVPIDVDGYKLSPDGRKALITLGVFTDCADLACTKERLDGRAADKASGTVYDKLFVRHWDTWADGRRAQLFITDLDNANEQPVLLTRGIDGDVPSKPFGDEGEFASRRMARRCTSTRASPARASRGRPTSMSTACRPMARPRRAISRPPIRPGMLLQCRRRTARRCTTSR